MNRTRLLNELLCNRTTKTRTETELTCQETYSYGGRELAHCYDDQQCRLYGDCCRNSKFYDETEQTVQIGRGVYNNSRYGCRALGDGGGTSAPIMTWLIIDSCPRTAADGPSETSEQRKVRDMCERGLTAGYPVIGGRTGHAYANAYCAWCRGERDRVVYWKPVFQCYGPVGGGGDATATLRLEDASDGTLLHRDGRWYRADYENGTLSECGVHLERPDSAPAPPRPCVLLAAGTVDGCPPDAAAALARACARYTYVVFEKAEIGRSRAFRNVECARCNGVPVNRTTCEPPQPPLKIGFQTLFSLRAATTDVNVGGGGGGARRKPCGPDEIYDVLAAKCRDVIRDELQLRSTGCREYATFGPGEYDAASLDNDTAYVYQYKKRVRYRGGSGGAALRACVADADGLRLERDSRSAYATYLTLAGVVGSSVSAAALAAHLALFARSPGPRNLPDKNLASLSVGLLAAYAGYLGLAYGAVPEGPGWPCLASALAMHFGFLAAFAWMSVMSVDVWFVLRASTKKLRMAAGRRHRRRFAVYSAFAWLAPAALTAITAALQLRWPAAVAAAMPRLRPHLQHDCWFRNPESLVALFVAPAGAAVAVNYVSFVGAVRLIATSRDSPLRQSADAVHRSRADLRVYVRLSLMMGLAWVFALAGAVTDSDIVWTVNTALNSLHGAFIFLTFDCNWNATRVLALFRAPPPSSGSDPHTTSTAVAPLNASH